MSRRMWAGLVGGALAIGAVIAGSFIAIGQDSDDSRTPTGAENRMRLEAINSEVSCGSIAAVRIYLDDLVPRESGRTPGVSAGMVGFQATLQYDPEILRILAPNDIQLNSKLGQQDVDGDGLVRSFISTANLSDHLGRAIIGAVSYVPGSQSLADNREEGIDPVAKGEPLLLMTVRFTPVGQGTTTIRNAGWDGALASVEPQVFDTDGEFYEPLKVEDTEITVRGGDCLPPPPSPTTQPTSTPIVVPTRTPVVFTTVEPVDAATGGRSDCPEDWVVYEDQQNRFSVCYPADFDATASDVSVNLGSPDGDASIGIGLSVLMYWDPTPGTVYHPPSEENCSMELTLGERLSTGVVDLLIGDELVAACLTESREGDSTPILRSLRTAVPLARDGSDSKGYIQLRIGFSGTGADEIPELVTTILQTLLVSRS